MLLASSHTRLSACSRARLTAQAAAAGAAGAAAGQGGAGALRCAAGKQQRIVGAARRGAAAAAAAAGGAGGGGEGELVELIKKKNMENPVMVYRCGPARARDSIAPVGRLSLRAEPRPHRRHARVRPPRAARRTAHSAIG